MNCWYLLQTIRIAAVSAAWVGWGIGLGLAFDSTTSPADADTRQTNHQPAVFLSTAQFQIPFSIDPSGTQPTAVQLFVSTDEGKTWQQQGSVSPEAGHFDFRAAAEGNYWFTVRTVDSAGTAFPSPNPPMHVAVDTSKPEVAIQADLDQQGNLIVDIQAADSNLDLQTGILRVRTDRETNWREIPVESLQPIGDHYAGQIELILPSCREVLMVLSIMDLAKQIGQATFQFTMPRTAVNQLDMQLASSRGSHNQPGSSLLPGENIPGATAWDLSATGNPKRSADGTPLGTQSPEATPSDTGRYPTIVRSQSVADQSRGTGRLVGNAEVELSPSQPVGPQPEELELPRPVELAAPDSASPAANAKTDSYGQQAPPVRNQTAVPAAPSATESKIAQPNVNEPSVPDSQMIDPDRPYYCKARTFSLDYSAEALGGGQLSEVELWGTEDQGRSWEKWGTDPDRTSPFDVKVVDDGLFGFRMVLVGNGGYVLGQPKPGDSADIWIHVDTEAPRCKITRAVYGEGSEAGMLVIDYNCLDADLAEHPVSLAYSASLDGPWTPFASGLKNTSLYLWKVQSDMPSRVYLRLEAIDKAGNLGTHLLDLPVNMKGLAPRGRIEGIRPILSVEGSR